jgi:hypothetical protein
LFLVHQYAAPALQMRHLAAYLLLVLGGKATPSAADIKGVLSAAGIDASDDDIGRLLPALAGKVRACLRPLGRGTRVGPSLHMRGGVRLLASLWTPRIPSASCVA